MVVKFNHLLPAMPELGMGLPNAYIMTGPAAGKQSQFWRLPTDLHQGRSARFWVAGGRTKGDARAPQAAVRGLAGTQQTDGTLTVSFRKSLPAGREEARKVPNKANLQSTKVVKSD